MVQSMRMCAVVWASAAGLVSLSSGCNVALPGRPVEMHEETRTLATGARADSPLRVATDNGSVRIERAGTEQVTIKARLKARSAERLADAAILAERDRNATIERGGALEIGVRWPDGRRFDNEGCDFTVLTPGESSVDVETSNGAVVLEGVSGPATVRTSNGAVTVRDHDGSVDVETSNGTVTLTKIAGAVRSRSSNGSMTATLDADNAGPVSLETSNGQVFLSVGEAFVGRLTLSTSNGALNLKPPAHAERVDVKKNRVVLIFNSEKPASRVETSNGSIHLETADF